MTITMGIFYGYRTENILFLFKQMGMAALK